MLARIFLLFSIVFLCFACSKDAKNTDKDNFLFRQIPSEVSNVDFINKIEEDAKHNIINYIYYYNGGGVSAGDINNDGLVDLFFVSNQGENKLYLNKGTLKFEDISKSSGTTGKSSWSTGATMVDINSDGFLDIYVSAVNGLLDFTGHNELYINNGDGTFSEKAKEYGLDFRGFSTQSYFFDYDKDGDLDVYIVNHAIHTTLSHGPAIARGKRMALVGDVLFRNEDGKFIDVSKEANIYGGVNGYGLSASIADFNNDGWEDIYVCNDFHEDDYYYINTKDGSFKEALAGSFSTIGRFSMGSDAADVNNDGFTDLITLDMLANDERVLKESEGDEAMFNVNQRLSRLGYRDQYSRNMLQISNSGKDFYESAIFNGVANTDWSWAPLIADFDNDGHQDLFITNGILRRPNDMDFKQYVSSALKKGGNQAVTEWLYKSIDEMPSGKVPNRIFQGNSKRFSDKSGIWLDNDPSLSNGAIYTDLDNDGDLDLVTNNLNANAGIFENRSDSTRNHLALNLRYKNKNLEGIGAKISVFTENTVQTKMLSKSRGFMSSVASSLHFGLDTISKVDSIQILWPDFTVQTVLHPNVNQKLDIEYSDQEKEYAYKIEENEYAASFQKVNMIDYTHIEDSFNDNYRERLIPYKVSMQG
ncbi:CRTAC1 family protein, partial [Maribacter sp.]|nr:CRTAC1 family protein [Maribacter sp.]